MDEEEEEEEEEEEADSKDVEEEVIGREDEVDIESPLEELLSFATKLLVRRIFPERVSGLMVPSGRRIRWGAISSISFFAAWEGDGVVRLCRLVGGDPLGGVSTSS